MNWHHVVRNNSYLFMIIFTLLGCTTIQTVAPIQTSTPLTTTNEIEVVFTPTPEEVFDAVTIVPGETPYPFSLDDVSCQFEGVTIEPDVEHWTDALIPGTSTIDDLAAIHKITEEPQQHGYWNYSFGDLHFYFNDGILQERNDVRTELKEVISHYGYPEQIVWEIPRYRSIWTVPITNFMYPSRNTYFYTYEKVIQLRPDIELYSTIASPEYFQSIFSESFQSEDFEYFYLDWPCQ